MDHVDVYGEIDIDTVDGWTAITAIERMFVLFYDSALIRHAGDIPDVATLAALPPSGGASAPLTHLLGGLRA